MAHYKNNLLVVEGIDIQMLRAMEVVEVAGEQRVRLELVVSKKYEATSDQPRALYLTDDGAAPRLLQVTPAPPAAAPAPAAPVAPPAPAPAPATPPPAPAPAPPSAEVAKKTGNVPADPAAGAGAGSGS